MSQEENKEENDQENNDKEKAIIWDLEVWKRAEQTQFKAYLKQLEFEHLSKLQEDFRNKENEREKEFKLKINEIAAKKLYIGLVADTNRFLFYYTTSKTFELTNKEMTLITSSCVLHVTLIEPEP